MRFYNKVVEGSLDRTPTLLPTKAMSSTQEEVVGRSMDNAKEKQAESQAEDEAEPLTQIVAEMPESDIPAYIGRLLFNGHLQTNAQ